MMLTVDKHLEDAEINALKNLEEIKEVMAVDL